MVEQTFYEILGVSRSANRDEIKRAYRPLAQKFHPDKNLGDKESATETIIQLNRALDTLTDPQLRMAYDRRLDAMARLQKSQENIAQRKASEMRQQKKAEESVLRGRAFEERGTQELQARSARRLRPGAMFHSQRQDARRGALICIAIAVCFVAKSSDQINLPSAIAATRAPAYTTALSQGVPLYYDSTEAAIAAIKSEILATKQVDLLPAVDDVIARFPVLQTAAGRSALERIQHTLESKRKRLTAKSKTAANTSKLASAELHKKARSESRSSKNQGASIRVAGKMASKNGLRLVAARQLDLHPNRAVPHAELLEQALALKSEATLRWAPPQAKVVQSMANLERR